MLENIWVAMAVGFIAQIIDGALGMAYGVSATSFLLSFGVSPAAASASVHAAEVFTTGASGLSHWKFGNVNKQLIKKLILPGMVGAALGAYILVNISGEKIKPYIAFYMLIMGCVVLYKAYRQIHPRQTEQAHHMSILGLVGGFFDAIGGGGWGPIVTSTLLARGNDARMTVGSVNATEFFVTLAASFTFFLSIGFTHWKVILGLIIGGVIASPFSAYICKKISRKHLMLLVGILIIVLSLRTLFFEFVK